MQKHYNSCRTEMSEQAILKHNPREKRLKARFTIYLDLECIFKKVQSSQKNPEKSYTEKIARHEPSGWSMFIRSTFDKKENKLNYYREKYCFKNLCKKLKEIINYKKRDIIPINQEKNNFYNEQ